MTCFYADLLPFAFAGAEEKLRERSPTYIEVRTRCKNLHRKSVRGSGRSSTLSDSERDKKQESPSYYRDLISKSAP